MEYSGTVSICKLIMKVIISLMGENDKPSMEPLQAYNMPLTTWENASFFFFFLEGGGFLWPHRAWGKE